MLMIGHSCVDYLESAYDQLKSNPSGPKVVFRRISMPKFEDIPRCLETIMEKSISHIFVFSIFRMAYSYIFYNPKSGHLRKRKYVICVPNKEFKARDAIPHIMRIQDVVRKFNPAAMVYIVLPTMPDLHFYNYENIAYAPQEVREWYDEVVGRDLKAQWKLNYNIYQELHRLHTKEIHWPDKHTLVMSNALKFTLGAMYLDFKNFINPDNDIHSIGPKSYLVDGIHPAPELADGFWEMLKCYNVFQECAVLSGLRKPFGNLHESEPEHSQPGSPMSSSHDPCPSTLSILTSSILTSTTMTTPAHRSVTESSNLDKLLKNKNVKMSSASGIKPLDSSENNSSAASERQIPTKTKDVTLTKEKNLNKTTSEKHKEIQTRLTSPGHSFVLVINDKVEEDKRAYDCVLCYESSNRTGLQEIIQHSKSKEHLLKVLELVNPKYADFYSKKGTSYEIAAVLKGKTDDLDKDGVFFATLSTFLSVRKQICNRIVKLRKEQAKTLAKTKEDSSKTIPNKNSTPVQSPKGSYPCSSSSAKKENNNVVCTSDVKDSSVKEDKTSQVFLSKRRNSYSNKISVQSPARKIGIPAENSKNADSNDDDTLDIQNLDDLEKEIYESYKNQINELLLFD